MLRPAESEEKSELPWFQEPVRAPELSDARSYGEEVKATLANLFVFDNAVESLRILNTLGPALKKVPAVFSALQSVLANIEIPAEDKSEDKAAVDQCKKMLTKLGFWRVNSNAKKKNLDESIKQLRKALRQLHEAIPTTHRKESILAKNAVGKISEIITILDILHKNVAVIVDSLSQNNNVKVTTAVITVCGELCKQTGQLTLLSSVLTTMSPTLLWSRRLTLVGAALPSLMDAVGNRDLLIQKIKELIQAMQSGGLWPPDSLHLWRLDCYRILLELINDPLIFKMFFNLMYNISIQIQIEKAKIQGSAVSGTLDVAGALQYLQYIPYFSYMSYFALFSNPQTSLVQAAFTVVDAIAPESHASLIKIAKLFTSVATLSPLEAVSASRGLLGDALAEIAQNRTSEELLAMEPHLQTIILPEILKGLLFNGEEEISQFPEPNNPSSSRDRTSGFVSKEKIDTGSRCLLTLLEAPEMVRDTWRMGGSALSTLTSVLGGVVDNGKSKVASQPREETPLEKQHRIAALKLDPELEPLWNPEPDQKENVTATLVYNLLAQLGKKINNEYIHCKKIKSPGAVSSAVYRTTKNGLGVGKTLAQKVMGISQSDPPAHEIKAISAAQAVDYSEEKKQALIAKEALDAKKDNILLTIKKLECKTPFELQAKYNEIYAEIVALDSEITETEKKFELCYEARIVFNSTELNYKKECIQALLKNLAIRARDLMLSDIIFDTPQLLKHLQSKPASEQINAENIDLFHKKAEQFIQFMGPRNRQPLEDFTESFYVNEVEAQVKFNIEKNKFLAGVLDQAVSKLEAEFKLEKFEFNRDQKDDYFINDFLRKIQVFREKINVLNNDENKKRILEKLDAFEKQATIEIKKQYQCYISDKLEKISAELMQEAIQCLSKPEENKEIPNRLEQLYSRVDSNNHENYAIGAVFPSYKLIPDAPELKSNVELKAQSSGGFLDYVSSAATAVMDTASSAVVAVGATIATTAISVGAYISGSTSPEDKYAAEIKGHEESVTRFNEKLKTINVIINEAKNKESFEDAIKKLEILSGQAELKERNPDDAQRREKQDRAVARDPQIGEEQYEEYKAIDQQRSLEQHYVSVAVISESPQRPPEQDREGQYEEPEAVQHRSLEERQVLEAGISANEQRPQEQHNEIFVANPDEKLSPAEVKIGIQRREEQAEADRGRKVIAEIDQQRLPEHDAVLVDAAIVAAVEVEVEGEEAKAERDQQRLPEHDAVLVNAAIVAVAAIEVVVEDEEEKAERDRAQVGQRPPEQHGEVLLGAAGEEAERDRAQREAAEREAEKIQKKAKAEADIARDNPNDLLNGLQFFISELPDGHPNKTNANVIHGLGLHESKIESSNPQTLAESLKLVIAVVRKPLNNEQEKANLAAFVKRQAERQAAGKSCLSNPFLYALGCLAVGAVAAIGLGLAGVPFAVSAAIGGSIFTAGGATFFCCRREPKQKGLSEAYTNSLSVLAPPSA